MIINNQQKYPSFAQDTLAFPVNGKPHTSAKILNME
jgi:hypothetical protein